MLSALHRSDLSQHLIHFTRETASATAFEVLIKIIRERRLVASTGFVKGGSPCISFTEAPFDVLSAGFNNPHGVTRYSSFGLRFDKAAIFDRGGRPVIYQPGSEYRLLPSALRWRHVRFDPTADEPVDFTWEREWRLPCDCLMFSDKEIEVVLPDESAASEFCAVIERDSFQEAWSWTIALGDAAWQYHGPNPWRILKCRERS